MKRMGYCCSTLSSLESWHREEIWTQDAPVWEKISMDRILGQEYIWPSYINRIAILPYMEQGCT